MATSSSFTAQAAMEFQKRVLSWNYFQLMRDKKEGKQHRKLQRIPESFASPEEYLATFEPLVLEECEAIVLNGDEDTGKGAQEAHAAVVNAVERRDPFLSAWFVLDDGVPITFAENDVVVVSKDRPNDREAEDVNEMLHALGIVESHEGGTGLRVKFNLDEASQTGLGKSQGAMRVKAVRTGLQAGNTCWFILKLANMSTITREWCALLNVRNVPFLQTLLNGKPGSDVVRRSRNLVVPGSMREVLEGQYNDRQVTAVTAGLDGSPMVLIQGPPGTGKTKTILGLLSIIMHSAPCGTVDRAATGAGGGGGQAETEVDRARLWALGAPWLSALNRRDIIPPDAEDGLTDEDTFGLAVRCSARRISEQAGPKAHVLVCAPSNSALDEIVLRILSTGLIDGQGRSYAPSVVRVGVNIHHSVQAVSLDHLVKSRRAQLEAAGKVISRQDADKIRMTIMEEASIICSTLAFSGSGVFTKMARKFDAIVIDEAAQAVEPSVLVALTQGAPQVYLVGDPNQLPATVISRRAISFGYDTSLFARLQGAGYPVQRLTTQYRMNPMIREFPSREFYEDTLEDGSTVVKGTARPWHALSPALGPLAMLDLRGKEEVPQHSASLINEKEAQCVVALYLEMAERFAELREPGAVGIVSPYKAQVKLLQDKLKQALGEDVARKRVDVNTIDGFQGREKDLVIFSTVRAREQRSIGFVADERRINVGLTRARSSMIVVGHAGALAQDGHWGNFVAHCRAKGCLFRVPPGKAMPPQQGLAYFRGQVKLLAAGRMAAVARKAAAAAEGGEEEEGAEELEEGAEEEGEGGPAGGEAAVTVAGPAAKKKKVEA